MANDHIHDCTGVDMRCACGYVFRIPPIFVSIEIENRGEELVSEHFNCESVYDVIAALRQAIGKLEAAK